MEKNPAPREICRRLPYRIVSTFYGKAAPEPRKARRPCHVLPQPSSSLARPAVVTSKNTASVLPIADSRLPPFAGRPDVPRPTSFAESFPLFEDPKVESSRLVENPFPDSRTRNVGWTAFPPASFLSFRARLSVRGDPRIKPGRKNFRSFSARADVRRPRGRVTRRSRA